MSGELRGRTIVITGATSGIGREVARHLAGRGGTVLGVGRDGDRCRVAEQEIRACTGNADVTCLAADLSARSEIRAVAAEIARRTPVIDALVNNAGVFTFSRKETVDGLETQLAVNWLAAFMLTGLLLPQLLQSGGARVVTVSSGSHFAGTMHWKDLGLRGCYRGLKAYDQSKLAVVLFSHELARRIAAAHPARPLESPRLATYAVDPGLVRTGIAAKGNNRLVKLVWSIRTMKGIPPARAAESVAWCAVDPSVAGATGLYWKERRSVPSSKESNDRGAARRLWELGELLCGVRYPAV